MPDLVFLDLMMAGIDGFEVLDKLLEMNPQARIVVATADLLTSMPEMVAAHRARAYILKL